MRKFFKAVAFITIFSVLTRALGFFLRIYLSRVMGAEVLGAYQVSMSIFGVLMTIVTSGMPLVVSRNVAYYNGQGDKKSMHKNITGGLIICVSLSAIITAAILIFPNFLSGIIKSQTSIDIILVLLPALVASAIYAILRGGLWGKKSFFAISFTEFFEQVVRIIFCVILFSLPAINMSVGQKSALSLTLSAIVSAALVVIIYFAQNGRLTNPKGTTLNLIKSSAPITIVKTASSIVSSVIAVLIPLRLMQYGYTYGGALAQYGIFMGMTMPLIMVPNTFTSSISVALVPEISSYTNNISDTTKKVNLPVLRRQIELAIKSAIIIAFVLLPTFLCLGRPICTILFNNAQAGTYLCACCILMLPMCINQVISSMLNAMGLELKVLASYAVGATLMVLCVWFLPPYIGTYAIFVGMLAMHTSSLIIGFCMLKKRQLASAKIFSVAATCLIICGLSATLGAMVYNVISHFANIMLSTLISGTICLSFTILLMFVFDLASIKMFVIKKLKQKRILKKHTA